MDLQELNQVNAQNNECIYEETGPQMIQQHEEDEYAEYQHDEQQFTAPQAEIDECIYEESVQESEAIVKAVDLPVE